MCDEVSEMKIESREAQYIEYEEQKEETRSSSGEVWADWKEAR